MARLSLPLRDEHALSDFTTRVLDERHCHVTTTDAPDLGAIVDLELIVGRSRRIIWGEVVGIDADDAKRERVRLALSNESLAALTDFARALGLHVGPELDEEPITSPGAPPALAPPAPSVPAALRLSAAVAQPLLAAPGPMVSAALAQSVAPASPSLVTPQPRPPRSSPPLAPSIRATGLTPAFSPSPAPRITGVSAAYAPPSPDETFWEERLTESFGSLGIFIHHDLVRRCARTRAAFPPSMSAAWALAIEWVATTNAQRGELLSLVLDIVVPLGGAIDRVNETGTLVVFFGLGAQGASALAAQALREAVEAFADGRTAPPSLKAALIASRLRAEPQTPVEGDGLNLASMLLQRARPGECLVPRNVALGVADLVTTQPAADDDVQLSARRPLLSQPFPSIGLDRITQRFDTHLAAVKAGRANPLVIAGPRRAGRTHLAHELARRAHGRGLFVALTSSLEFSGRCGTVLELLHHLAEVPFEERANLIPALTAKGVSPKVIQAALTAAGATRSPEPFTPRQAADAVRNVLDAVAPKRARVLLFDGLDFADAESVAVVDALIRNAVDSEFIAVLTTPAQAEAWRQVAAVHAIPEVSDLELDGALRHALSDSPKELREMATSRSARRPGLIVDLLLLTLARGGVRPKGEGLVLDGVVPMPTDKLASDRLLAEGPRCRQLLDAVQLLGHLATPARVAQVLPGAAQEAWPRATVARLLIGAGGRPLVSPSFREAVANSNAGPGLARRCAALLLTLERPTLATDALLAMALERSGELPRASTTWKSVAERAMAEHDLSLAANAQLALSRVLQRSQQSMVVLRQQLHARAACELLALGQPARANAIVDDALSLLPPGISPDLELRLAHARVDAAHGRFDEAKETVASALGDTAHPVRAAILAELAATLERANDLTHALETWHQALAAAPAFLPLAGWFGEIDFRARVEARIGALFITTKQATRGLTWLASSAERFMAAKAPRFAARVMADLGELHLALASFDDASHWFEISAVTASAGGDALFEAKQLARHAEVLARRGDRTKAKSVATEAHRLAVSLGWDEGAAKVAALRG